MPRLGKWRWVAGRAFFLAMALLVLQMTWNLSVCSAVFPDHITVRDSRGSSLTVEEPVERIVCLIESALTGLYMLGAQEKVVGISSNVYEGDVFTYYAALDARIANRQLPTPGNWDFLNVETVVALAPDLVIIWAHQTEAIASLEEKGIRVYGVQIDRYEDIYKEILDLGDLTGSRQRALTLIQYTRDELARIDKLVRSTKEKKKPGVYFMWAQSDLDTSGGLSTVNDLISLAGARNVCAHINREHTVVNLENLLQWNPDVVVMWVNPGASPDAIMTNPVWRNVKAVRQRRVHEFPAVFLCDLWTLKFQFAAKLVAAWCHPELESHLNLKQEARIMLDRLYGEAPAKRMPVEKAFH